MTGDTDNNNKESVDTLPTLDESKPSSETPKIPKEEPEKAKQTSVKKASTLLLKLWLLLITLLLLGLIGALAYGAYWSLPIWEERESNLSNLSARLSQQENIRPELDQKLADQREMFEQLLSEQQVQQQRLDSYGARISSLAGTSREDWLLAEARYLLRLANQRMLVEQGTDGALGLLYAADKILVDVGNRSVMPVRAAIAEEIIALKLAGHVDTEGLYLQLSALRQSIQSLPLIPYIERAETTSPTEVPASVDADATWQQRLQQGFTDTLHALKALIQIRQHDQAPELLISEQHQYQIINTLVLMIEQAQFALLHSKEAIYKDSLNKASEWWTAYYAHYREYDAIKAEFARLSDLPIVQTLPDISRSEALLSEYISQFHRLNDEPSSGSAP